MSDSTTTGNGDDVAVICDRHGPAAERVSALLRQQGWESGSTWYAPRDADDVERAISDGVVRTVVLDAPADLLRAAWDRRAEPDRWESNGVRIHFAQPPGVEQTRAMLDAWRDWDRRRRRGNTIAGLALTVVAMTLGFVLTRL